MTFDEIKKNGFININKNIFNINNNHKLEFTEIFNSDEKNHINSNTGEIFNNVKVINNTKNFSELNSVYCQLLIILIRIIFQNLIL